VMLQRTRPDRVYLACGNNEDLAARLCEGENAEFSVEVVAEFPRMGHALERAKHALQAAPCQNGWYEMHPGVALQALGVVLGATKPGDAPKKQPNYLLLRKDDKLLLEAIRDGKVAGKSELCEEDRKLLMGTWSTINRTSDMCDDMRNEIRELREELRRSTTDRLKEKVARSVTERAEIHMPRERKMASRRTPQGPLNDPFADTELWEPPSYNPKTEVPKACCDENTPLPRQEELPKPQHQCTTCPQERAATPEKAEWPHAPEDRYEDLSDLSTVNGHESPPHKRLKEYAAARRANKKPEDGNGAACTTHVESEVPAVCDPIEPQLQAVDLGAHLVPCAKKDAETASNIRQALRQRLGCQAAAALLGQCTQRVLRGSSGTNQRFVVDAAGATLRLVQQENVAPL